MLLTNEMIGWEGRSVGILSGFFPHSVQFDRQRERRKESWEPEGSSPHHRRPRLPSSTGKHTREPPPAQVFNNQKPSWAARPRHNNRRSSLTPMRRAHPARQPKLPRGTRRSSVSWLARTVCLCGEKWSLLFKLFGVKSFSKDIIAQGIEIDITAVWSTCLSLPS